MRIDSKLEPYRFLSGAWGSKVGDDYGAFKIPGPKGESLVIIASPGDEEIQWEHVSVSTRHRCPYWSEMCYVKDLFWESDETVMQLHPAKSDYVNNHNHCLHLWKPINANIPLPPSIAVGDKNLGVLR
jgi:hypothetical protein